MISEVTGGGCVAVAPRKITSYSFTERYAPVFQQCFVFPMSLNRFVPSFIYISGSSAFLGSQRLVEQSLASWKVPLSS